MKQIMIEPKMVWEVLPFTVDFSANLLSGESIALLSSLVEIKESVTGTDKTSTMLSGSISLDGSDTIEAVITGGETGVKYEASFKAFISATKKLQEDIVFSVL